jgi:hypothetical protein
VKTLTWRTHSCVDCVGINRREVMNERVPAVSRNREGNTAARESASAQPAPLPYASSAASQPPSPPLLANLFLHHVLDLWVKAWRKKLAQGDMIVVRYADDGVLGFQYREDADRFLADLRERLRKFDWNYIRRRRA